MLFQGLLGVLAILSLSWILSENRKEIKWTRALMGIAIAFSIGFIFNAFPLFPKMMLNLNKLISVLEQSSAHGARFIFGYLAGSDTPYELAYPQNNFIIAFRVFPIILLVTVLSNIALHLGILGKVIELLAIPVRKIFKIKPALALGAVASVFFGTIETPLVIKAWLKDLSRGELLALLACTMSTIAGTVMVLYAGILGDKFSAAAGHMMVASLMSVPIAISLTMIISPFESSFDQADIKVKSAYLDIGDAIASAIEEGLKMILTITATLIVIFALVHLFNTTLSLLPGSVTIESIMAYPLRPIMWLVGIPWDESYQAAALMGKKIVLNEFVAYLEMAKANFSQNTTTILTYAFCGFANIGSLGIVVGGLGQLLPERKKEIAVLGIKSVLIGNLATLMSAALISLTL